MQVTLFKALKSINIDDAAATAVVDQLEEHLEKMIGDAAKSLEDKLDATRAGLEASNKSLEAKLDAQRGQITMFTILIGVIGLCVTAAAAIAPTLAKLVH